MGASLTARGLVKQFAGKAAVDGVDLDIRPGEFVSLLGPSGCGKTTTLRMIAGLELADSGAIVIDGQDVTRLSPQKRNLGMVFQQYALFPNLTAFDNIAFALRVRRHDRDRITGRVNELLTTVHLEDAAQKYPHELSGGMQQRVALARALAIAPPLLLLDEPLSALDAAIRDSLRTELRRLQRQLNVSVVYVTHDQAEAMALSDTIVVMEDGRVSQTGTPQDLYDRPATRFTAAFVGSSNRRETRVRGDRVSPAIAWGDRTLPIVLEPTIGLNQAVTVSWRPESARVEPGEIHQPGTLTGSVEMITFLGPITRLDIRVPGDTESIMVDVASGAARAYQPGQTVSVTIPRESIRIYA